MAKIDEALAAAREASRDGTAKPLPYDPRGPDWKGRLFDRKSGMPPMLNPHAQAIISEAARELPEDMRQDFESKIAEALRECKHASAIYVQSVTRRILNQMMCVPRA